MIKVEHLTKRYGDFTAVDDLNFEINDGHVYGFLGPNGAGKSTTMNIMTGCLSASEGKVLIDGFDIFEQPKEAKKHIGYLPELPPLYMNETPYEYLRFVGEAKGLKEPELDKQIQEVLQKTRTENMQDRKISKLSKGYRQRVGIAQALLGNPKVIILDEPTVGLDPMQIIEIRELIKELGKEHTVILSSHILSEVQTICEKILIINKGKLIAFDTPEKLEESMSSSGGIRFTVDCTEKKANKIMSHLNIIKSCKAEKADNDHPVFSIETNCENIYDAARQLFFAFSQEDCALLEIKLKKANLEEIFIELTEENEKEIKNL